jgi:hypothetical protein
MKQFYEFVNNPPVLEILITEVVLFLFVCLIIHFKQKRAIIKENSEQ